MSENLLDSGFAGLSQVADAGLCEGQLFKARPCHMIRLFLTLRFG